MNKKTVKIKVLAPSKVVISRKTINMNFTQVDAILQIKRKASYSLESQERAHHINNWRNVACREGNKYTYYWRMPTTHNKYVQEKPPRVYTVDTLKLLHCKKFYIFNLFDWLYMTQLLQFFKFRNTWLIVLAWRQM